MSALVRRAGLSVAVVLTVLSIVFAVSLQAARATEVSFQGLSVGSANGLYCQLVGCTMTGTLNLRSSASTKLSIGSASTGYVSFVENGQGVPTESISTCDTTNGCLGINPGNSTAIGITMRSNNLTKLCSLGTAGTETIGCYLAAAPSLAVNAVGGTQTAAIGATGTTNLPSVLNVGWMVHTPNSGLTIGNPTDTTSNPLSGNCTVCKMSAAAAAAWTPVETNAQEGARVSYCNTGTFAITMTASAGVYVGPGSVVGQNDCVEMTYLGAQWVETNFQNNP